MFILLLFVAALLGGNWFQVKEGYCGCSGAATKVMKPTYYVYRQGDVSNYAPKCLCNTAANYNLGWKGDGVQQMPYDLAYNGNSWAAGSDPGCRYSSVPMLVESTLDKVQGYAQNYGSSCSSNSMSNAQLLYLSNPSTFIQGVYGAPSCGDYSSQAMAPSCTGCPSVTPYSAPAGSFSDATPCASANAYNLGIGVL